MREFDLSAVDWDTVRLIQAGQFKHERHYHEELVRWVMFRGGIQGVLRLDDEGISFPSPVGGMGYSVKLRGITAVTEQGRIIEIPEDEPLEGTIDASRAPISLYVGVAVTDRALIPELHPSADTGLLQCGGRGFQYQLSSDNSDGAFDWLEIGRYERTQTGLVPDAQFVPECMFLSSHAVLWGMHEAIVGLARQCLQSLQTNSDNNVAVYSAATSLGASLGPAARMVNGSMHPRAYLDRIAGVLTAQHAQLHMLPQVGLANYQSAVNRLEATLGYLDSEWEIGQALIMARECFELLLRLYPDLLRGLGAVAPAEKRLGLPQADIAVPVPTNLPAQPGYRRYTEYEESGGRGVGSVGDRPQDPPKKGTIFRR